MRHEIFFKNKKQQAEVEEILALVARTFGVSVLKLKSTSRHTKYVIPRHIAMLLIHRLAKMSLGRTGAIFQKDHSTVINAKKKILKRMENNKLLKNTYNSLRKTIKEFMSSKGVNGFQFESQVAMRSINNATTIYNNLTAEEKIEAKPYMAVYKNSLMDNYWRI